MTEPVDASYLYGDAPRLCLVLFFVYSSMLVIFVGQCMPRIFLRCALRRVLTV